MKPKKWVNPCDLNSPLGEYVYLGQESFLSKYATGSSGGVKSWRVVISSFADSAHDSERSYASGAM